MLTKGESHKARGGFLAAALSESDARSSDWISFRLLHEALELSSRFCLKVSADKHAYKSQLV